MARATVADIIREIEGLPGDAPVTMSVDVVLPGGRAVMLAFEADAVIGACGQLVVEGCCEVPAGPWPA